MCNAPWTSAVIEADGAVRPCFFHRSIGTLKSGEDLKTILNGPAAREFRSTLDVQSNPFVPPVRVFVVLGRRQDRSG